MHVGTLRQILLITDGCSNKGDSPSAMAALAYEKGIVVNVIGVLEQSEFGTDLKEINEIASSGGGISQIVQPHKLSHTVQMVTRQAMTQTIHGVVNQQLKQILGDKGEWDSLSPDKRGQLLEVVDDLGERAKLEVAILVDVSASMSSKLQTVKEAIFDLSISLKSREGANRYCVYLFPGKYDDSECLLNWTSDFEQLKTVFPKLTTGGMTPTGNALRQVMEIFYERYEMTENRLGDEDVV